MGRQIGRAGPRRQPAPVAAALLMVGMALCYATTANIARLMAEDLNAPMIALLRNGFGLIPLLPLLLRGGLATMRTTRPALHVVRSALNLAFMLAWFWALPHIVLADGVALMFTGPLFGALGAVLLLGERLGPRRAGALAVGFAGALLIVRPSFDQAGLALLAVLGAAAGWAAMGLCNKVLTRTDGADQIVVLNVLLVLPFSFAVALPDWQWPSLQMWALGVPLGTLGTLAHVCMAHAFRHADASFCMPFDFTRLPSAAAIAFVLFGQLPDLWTILGAAVIFSATLYVTLRERRR
ncbi:MAG TPA: DMT family transporter [Geminicoccaceae bacterium]|nr:DMT family transporter [Geminicoccaceae bacterium]